ncbi:HD-GYP domain-containing protein [Aromatoleum petrolei]|uniref:HD domain-containing protein n=1 Tax=Aromatoleum petrolei TaxID=76116 RepID=A0ABX1MMB8_9RHOO|nr:HD domain-containing phosphohydrolase [Aromatoleum petrolei]NMF87269.1 HD domain-containing protein [Aromatoleum petrolei]QTQ38514.1 HD domain-containing protein [Aromatoleum petrolei]
MSVTDSWQEFAASAARQAGNLHVASVSDKVRELHLRIRERYPSISRIAVALYDPQMRRLKTFVASNEPGITPLNGYECAIDSVPSLLAIAESGQARVINDLGSLPVSDTTHSRWLHHEGFLSSLTLPIRREDQLLGFLFFDARERDVFTDPVVADLLLYGHLIGMIVTQELATVQMLVGGLRLASQFAHVRDLETGAHLDRMARYSRLIAREIGPAHGKTDDYAENIFLFSALHDIGKVGVPDRILLKPGKLDDAEREEMRRHVIVGLQMAERLISDFGLASLSNIDMLRNIVSAHHERMDGSGYPHGLAGDAIPLEARIVATADVFDALACARSYKPAWTLGNAFEEIRRMSGTQLYAPTVEALLDCREEVEAIYQRFQDAKLEA